MKEIFKNLKHFPIIILFFVILFGLSVLDPLWPKQEHSEMENRKLAQSPTISVKGLLSNEWMVNYEKYVKDQFLARDSWITLKSRFETALLKTENNDFYMGKDGFLFTQTLSLDEARFTKNLNAVKLFSERHPGMVDVMIVPSSSTILADKLPANAPHIDENVYLNQINETLMGAATVYDTRDTLAANKNDYIYFRTDHHWTSHGAYLAYQQYAAAKNLPIFNTTSTPKIDVEGFLGTSFSTARPANVKADTITYYDLPNQMDAEIIQSDGTIKKETLGLYDLAKLDTRDKYAAFLYGNNPFLKISGNEAAKGKLLVVKDSYANSFIPYLLADYAQVDVVDFRTNNKKIDAIIAEGGYDSILMLYSFDGFAEDMFFASRIASA